MIIRVVTKKLKWSTLLPFKSPILYMLKLIMNKMKNSVRNNLKQINNKNKKWMMFMLWKSRTIQVTALFKIVVMKRWKTTDSLKLKLQYYNNYPQQQSFKLNQQLHFKTWLMMMKLNKVKVIVNHNPLTHPLQGVNFNPQSSTEQHSLVSRTFGLRALLNNSSYLTSSSNSSHRCLTLFHNHI